MSRQPLQLNASPPQPPAYSGNGSNKTYPQTCQFFQQSELALGQLFSSSSGAGLANRDTFSPMFGQEDIYGNERPLDFQNFETLAQVQRITLSFCEALRLVDTRHRNHAKIPHVAMTIMHICLKKIHSDASQYNLNSSSQFTKTEASSTSPLTSYRQPNSGTQHHIFDLKLLILSCIRISAVIHDIEYKQDDFTKVYYESVQAESNRSAYSQMKEPRSPEEQRHLNDITPRYIPYEKIMSQLRQKFLMNQEQVQLIIGYNFEFFTPFEHIYKFQDAYWNTYVKKMLFPDNHVNLKNTDYQTLKDIWHRLFVQISQVALDSSILPLSLYFEPEEIAAACIILGYRIFKVSRPRFALSNYQNRTKMINQLQAIDQTYKQKMGTQMLTGEKIIELHFDKFKQASSKHREAAGGPLGIDIDLETDWFHIEDEKTLIASQPHWFKYLIDKNDRYDQIYPRVPNDHRTSSQREAPVSVNTAIAASPEAEDKEQYISMQQVELIILLILKSTIQVPVATNGNKPMHQKMTSNRSPGFGESPFGS